MKVKDLESTLEVMKKQHGKIVKPRNEVSVALGALDH